MAAGAALTFIGTGCKRQEGSSGAQYASSHNIDTLPPAPANRERDFTCPTKHTSLDVYDGGKLATRYLPAGVEKAALWNGLEAVLPMAPDLHVTVILIRRKDGVPHYLYLSNGTQDKTFQPWSSSKHMAFAALGSRLREASGGRVGLDGDLADPNGGRVPIGDLVTASTTYEFSCDEPKSCRGGREVPYLTSNNVATWAKNLAGRASSERLVRDWLGRAGERFDGGYQLYSASHTARGNGLGFTVRAAGQQDIVRESVTLRAPPIPAKTENRLSTLTMAEFLKRLVMHRENPQQAVPFLKWADVSTILYGAPTGKSKYFQHMEFGGMQGGASTYIQAAFPDKGVNTLESSTRGQWRTFTKIGWGPGGKTGNDFAWHGYGCVPRFDPLGRAEPSGKEFIISAFLPRRAGRIDSEQDRILTSVVTKLVQKIMDGSLDPANPVGAPRTVGTPGAL